jgi:hypothetical protein
MIGGLAQLQKNILSLPFVYGASVMLILNLNLPFKEALSS